MEIVKTRNTIIIKEPETILEYKGTKKDKIYYKCKRCHIKQRGYIRYHKEYPIAYPRFCQYCGAKLFKLEGKLNEEVQN